MTRAAMCVRHPTVQDVGMAQNQALLDRSSRPFSVVPGLVGFMTAACQVNDPTVGREQRINRSPKGRSGLSGAILRCLK